MNLAAYKLQLPKPYLAENYAYLKMSLKGRGLLDTVKDTEGAEHSLEHLAIGSSNLITLIVAGKKMSELSQKENLALTSTLDALLWKAVAGAPLWESAATLEPENLAGLISASKLLPSIDWEKQGILTKVNLAFSTFK